MTTPRVGIGVRALCLSVVLGLLSPMVNLHDFAGAAPVSPLARKTAPEIAESNNERLLTRAGWTISRLGGISPDVFELALGAANCAIRSGAVSDPRTLTVIDYSKSSVEKRLWVFDLADRELLHQELVAHGQGSGMTFATQFSNRPESHQTSLGLFVTEDTYVGRNGYSLRLNGLDRGFNDRARERAIVMHGAPYVSTDFAKAQGRIGRSWGCPALSDAVARTVIDQIKGGGLVFAYYPDPQWLRASKFLQCQGGDGASTR